MTFTGLEVSEEKMFNECGRQMYDGQRTTEAYLSYKLTSGELKIGDTNDLIATTDTIT